MTDFELNALLLSIKIGLVSTLFILIPGIIIAWVLAKKNFFGKTLIDALVHLPLVIEQHAQTCLAMGAELIYLHDLK